MKKKTYTATSKSRPPFSKAEHNHLLAINKRENKIIDLKSLAKKTSKHKKIIQLQQKKNR